MYLIYDCSSISKPINNKEPFSNTLAWPRLIHLSWIILDKDLKPTENNNYIVKPDEFTFNEDIAKRCSLTQKDLDTRSHPLEEVLKAFDEGLKLAYYVFSHNQNFNENVIAAEFLRKGIDHSLFRKLNYCLMRESTFFCKLPSKTGGYKWPTLSELHAIIFQKAYSPPNNARADVIAATRCFKALMMGKQLEDLLEDA